MSKAGEKPATREAIKKSGLTYARLAEELGWNRWDVANAVGQQLSPERAGEFVRTLATFVPLGGKERREIFREVINQPGKDAPLSQKISTEDPFEELDDAATRLGFTDYEQAERDARDLFGKKNEDP